MGFKRPLVQLQSLGPNNKTRKCKLSGLFLAF